MPEEFVRYGESWMDFNPGFEQRLWTLDNLPKLRNEDLFNNCRRLAEQADVVEFEVLMQFGGIYVDCDFECLKPFDQLLEEPGDFIGREDDHYLCNAIYGAERDSIAVRRIVYAMPQVLSWPNTPQFLTGNQSSFFAGMSVRIFPPSMFYPYHHTEKHRKGESFPDAFAVHHWAGSWLKHS